MTYNKRPDSSGANYTLQLDVDTSTVLLQDVDGCHE